VNHPWIATTNKAISPAISIPFKILFCKVFGKVTIGHTNFHLINQNPVGARIPRPQFIAITDQSSHHSPFDRPRIYSQHRSVDRVTLRAGKACPYSYCHDMHQQVEQRVKVDEDNVRFYWITADAMERVLTAGSAPPEVP
jgi:hypothetical protein